MVDGIPLGELQKGKGHSKFTGNRVITSSWKPKIRRLGDQDAVIIRIMVFKMIIFL